MRKRNEQALLGVEGGRGEDRRTLPPVPRVLSFFSLLRFCKFQTACFPRPFQIWPNRRYFKSSVHTGMSKEEAIFLKL